METKDRIKRIMEDQHMTQQVFADFLQQSPATLSSIFNGRTRPTLNIVDAIKAKIPDISIEWLLYGTGDMYVSHSAPKQEPVMSGPPTGGSLMLDFDTPAPQAPVHHQTQPSVTANTPPDRLTRAHEEIRVVEKAPRHVTEIRVYYDDQTYETFVPAKK